MSAIAKFKIIDARNELQLIQKTVEIVPGLKDEEKNEMSYLTKLMDKRINKFSENVFNYLKEKSTREIDRIKISKSILQILQEPVSLVLNNQLKIIIEQLKKLAQKDIPILLIGETGTGKTILAQHYKNFTGLDKFIKVNCGAIHENLIESELFGHEKGAFTDAKSTRVGLLKVADGGILFLDEIDSLHQNHQAKLLTALEKHVFRPVGSNNEVFSHFRLICASGKDLLVGDKFRQDLYYRIGSFQIHILPLREWEESKVKELFESFIMRYEFLFGIKVIQIEPSVIQFIQKYNWPGNIRQMDNVAQRAVFFSKEGVIRISDIYKDPLIDQFDLKGLGDLEKMEAKHEDELRQLVVRKLAECDGNVSQVAKIVKCESSKVYKWLKKWKIDTNEFRKKSE